MNSYIVHILILKLVDTLLHISALETLEFVEPKYPICASSVIWGSKYQNVHNLIVKHRSIKAQHPSLPHIVLAVTGVPQEAIDAFLFEGMIVKLISHVNYTAENREFGFEKIMTKLKALELFECKWVIQMDIDTIVLGSIVEAVTECQSGGYLLCGVPQTTDCNGRECCKPQANGNTLHVLVVNTGFLVYRTNAGLLKKLFETLVVTKAMREQSLWGEMICYNEDVPVHMLSWKFNAWSDVSSKPDIHVLHYGVGPAFLGGDVIPLTKEIYEMHQSFSYYRKLSLRVDGCSQHLSETECLSNDILEPVKNVMANPRSSFGNREQELRLSKCMWKGDRCISSNFSSLQLGDINQEIRQMAGANAALQCAFKDNPAAALAIIYNCGTFCMTALLWEDYCEKNFSIFSCTGLIFRHVVDYRSYNLIPLGIASLYCLPAIYRWTIIGSIFLISVTFCSFMWLCLIASRKVCRSNCIVYSKCGDENDKMMVVNPSLIFGPIVYADHDNLQVSTFTKIRDTIISINLTNTLDKTK